MRNREGEREREVGWEGERKEHELCTVWSFISFIRKPHDSDSFTHTCIQSYTVYIILLCS